MDKPVNQQINIRYAAVEDAAKLGDIHVRSWQAAYQGIVPDEVLNKLNPQKSQQLFAKLINEGAAQYGVILDKEELIGFISFGKSRDEEHDEKDGEIYALYLDPQKYHQGYGTPLFQWGIAELTKKGFSRIFLWVLEENLDARKFYTKNGFVYDGVKQEITIGKTLIECRYRITVASQS